MLQIHTFILHLTIEKYKTNELSRVKNEMVVLQMRAKSLID
jgi:hypothetical protein